MIKKCLLYIFLLIPIIGFSQRYSVSSKKAIKLYEEALHFYDYFQTDLALNNLTKAISIEPGFIEAYLVLADIYKVQNQKQKEIESYHKIIEIDSSFFVYTYYNLAQAEFSIGKYLDAKKSAELFLNYLQINPDIRIKAIQLVRNCIFADSLVNHPVKFNPIHLGNKINTQFDDYWPSITADDSVFVTTVLVPFSIDGKTALQEDFYISYKLNGEWTQTRPLGIPINTTGNEGAQSLFVDGKSYFYTACNRKKGFGACDLYFVSQENGKWQDPIILKHPINTRYSEKQPSISSDGKKLYFASNRPGGKGKMDIWMSELDTNGIWKEPTNLGDSINTVGDEISPYIHFDDKTLYFSSNRRMGLGGFDIFISRYENETWTQVQNVGYPINTHQDEIGLIVSANGSTAYYSTQRGNDSSKEIYKFDLPKEVKANNVTYVKGNVYDIDTKEKLEAAINLYNILDFEISRYFKSDNEGEFLITLPPKSKYAFNVSKTGYLFYSEHFDLTGFTDSLKPFYLDIPLQKIEVGNTTILKNVFFDVDSYELLDDSRFELKKLIELLHINSSLIIEIGGHTDNSGAHDYNMELSNNRAKSVYNFLVDNGIEVTRLSFKGYGESNPIDSNDTELGRSKNRRTEFKVMNF